MNATPSRSPSTLQQRLGLRLPVMLAPMAGGPGSARLAAAVSQAGGLGCVGSAYFTAAQISQAAQEVRQQTTKPSGSAPPFALSLFARQSLTPISAAQLSRALDDLRPIHAALGLGTPSLPVSIQQDFDTQFAAVLEAKPAALCFTFGMLAVSELEQLRAASILSIGTACSVSEALLLANSGVDAITVQGLEAGGHRGSWTADSRLPTLELLRAVRAVVDLPLVAAGGIMTRQDVQVALAAGAGLVSCGTAFLCAQEAGTSAPYRQALQAGGPTSLTQAFSGRWARGLNNQAMQDITHPLPTPQQNALTQAMRSAATAQGRAEYLSLWAGTGVDQLHTHSSNYLDKSAAEIVAQLWPA